MSLIGIVEESLLQLTLSNVFVWMIYIYLLCGILMENCVFLSERMLLKFLEEYVNFQISMLFQTNVDTWFWTENLVLILSSFFCAGKSRQLFK